MKSVIAKNMQDFKIFICEIIIIGYVLHSKNHYINSENYFSLRCSKFHYGSETNFINGNINRVIGSVTIINTLRFQILEKYGMQYAFA